MKMNTANEQLTRISTGKNQTSWLSDGPPVSLESRLLYVVSSSGQQPVQHATLSTSPSMTTAHPIVFTELGANRAVLTFTSEMSAETRLGFATSCGSKADDIYSCKCRSNALLL